MMISLSFDTTGKKFHYIREGKTNKNRPQTYIGMYHAMNELENPSAADISDREILEIACIRDENGNPAYGVTARYAENSTGKDPVIQVCVTKAENGRKYYNITINDIDPNRAAELEMFALCSYADDLKLGAGRIFDSWQTLKNYEINASLDHNVPDSGAAGACYLDKKDWGGLCMKMVKEYEAAGIMKPYKDGIVLMSVFSNILHPK